MEQFKPTTLEFIKANLDKFPRAQAIYGAIDKSKELVTLLNKRKEFINEEINSDAIAIHKFDLNEKKITLIKTDQELAKVHTATFLKEKEIIDYFERYIIPFADEITEKWAPLMEKAREKAKKDHILAGVLNDTPIQETEQNWEIKFNHYLAIRNYIHPEKAKMQALKN